MTGWAGERVLVTGGSGVIGRELLHLLSAEGATVLSIDRRPPPEEVPPDVEHRQMDLARDDLAPVLQSEPQAVFHLAAAFERARESREFWPVNWGDNVVGSHRLLNGALSLPGLEVFVFASSYLVYDSGQYLGTAPPSTASRLDEASRLRPRNLCGAAKLYTEEELAFAAEGGFRAVSARIFRVYGRGSRDVISRWVRAGLRGDSLEVYHPENRFDYIYAGDVAEGLLRLGAAHDARGPVNLGTGRARRVSDVLAVLRETLPAEQLPRREVEVEEPYEASEADIGRLKALTRWEPATSLEEGIRLVVDHERQA